MLKDKTTTITTTTTAEGGLNPCRRWGLGAFIRMVIGRRRDDAASLRGLEDRLGYRFRDQRLLVTALTHPSSRDHECEGDADNQRMEFLGDAVLGLLVAAELYGRHQNHAEGVLTCLRSRVTNGRMLGRIAGRLRLGDYIHMAPGEERMGGRRRTSTLADALESVFGAAYVDGGMVAVKPMFEQLIVPALDHTGDDVWAENPKGELQCFTQRLYRQDPVYRLRAQDGSRHEPVFTVDVLVRGEVVGSGSGSNKRQAQFAAARMALNALGHNGETDAAG